MASAPARRPGSLLPSLPPERAERFAKKILEACQLIREEHYLKPSEAQLLDLGIHGFYKRLREPVPADILRRPRLHVP